MTQELRKVKLPPWMWEKYYKDRHPQGVVYFNPCRMQRFVHVYRSHKTVEGAIESAKQLNERNSMWRFEAVTFERP